MEIQIIRSSHIAINHLHELFTTAFVHHNENERNCIGGDEETQGMRRRYPG